MATEAPSHRASPCLVCPFALTVDVIDRMLNFEMADDPHYTGLEVQAFDDPDHGAGILAFASRRDDGCADVYRQPGLVLDPAMFQVGHGVGVWTESAIDPARLDVTDFGVDAEIGLQDRDGRRIELAIDDRSRRRRRPAGLLAPFGAAVEQPTTLLLAYMRRFDLVRRGGAGGGGGGGGGAGRGRRAPPGGAPPRGGGGGPPPPPPATSRPRGPTGR